MLTSELINNLDTAIKAHLHLIPDILRVDPAENLRILGLSNNEVAIRYWVVSAQADYPRLGNLRVRNYPEINIAIFVGRTATSEQWTSVDRASNILEDLVQYLIEPPSKIGTFFLQNQGNFQYGMYQEDKVWYPYAQATIVAENDLPYSGTYPFASQQQYPIQLPLTITANGETIGTIPDNGG